MSSQHSVRSLCSLFGVSSSGYYDWCKKRREPGPRARQDIQLQQQVLRIHARSHSTYGSPRVRMQLRKEGYYHGRNRIARIMRENDLSGRQRRSFRTRTTHSDHDHPIAPNRLLDAPDPTAPNQIWVADITYIPTRHGWLYLAAILDLFSRKVVGWATSRSIDTALVLDALNMALIRRQPRRNRLIFHSDRGCQYASGAFRRALKRAAITPSMSRKANCYDNAHIESFWSSIKWELIFRNDFVDHAQARKAISKYIETFYNPIRIHSSLGAKSPMEFERDKRYLN